MSFTCTKTFDCVSTAHRNWRAKDNPNRDSKKCSYIHGYTKSFSIVFGCESLDEFQWVYDYGTTSTGEERTMTSIKKFIQETLDHGVTTDDQDPMLAKLFEMHELELIKLVVIPVKDGQSGSVEGLCRYLYNTFDPLLRKETDDRVWIESVTISEHHLNSSTYSRPTTQNISVNIPNKETVNAMNSEIEKQVARNSAELKEEIFNDEWIKKTFIQEEQLESKSVLQNIINDLGLNEDQFKSLQSKATQVLENNKGALDKLLTKENLDTAATLLKLHPKARAASASIDLARKLLDANPQILDILKGEIK